MLSWIYYLLGYDEDFVDEKQKRQKYLVTEQIKNSKLKLRQAQPTKPKPVFVKRGKFYRGKLV